MLTLLDAKAKRAGGYNGYHTPMSTEARNILRKLRLIEDEGLAILSIFTIL